MNRTNRRPAWRREWCWIVVLGVWATAAPLLAQNAPPAWPPAPDQLVKQMSAGGYYAREDRDQLWHIRISGELPRQPGVLILVLSAEGRLVHRAQIPSGVYPANKPYTIAVKPDGVTGDYLIKIVGHQHNLTGMLLPLTDLPYEVYGGSAFAIGYGGPKQVRTVALRVPNDDKPVILSGWRANLRVRDQQGRVVVDSKTDLVAEGTPQRYWGSGYFEVHAPLQVQQTYWLEPYESLYIFFKEPAYLTFEPRAWFLPDPRLLELSWWRLP